jgi:NADPH:quinone reductase-like Zn-dependent oxidoreductase
VDAVFDPIGGAGQLWRSYRALRKGGRFVWFGVAGTSRHGIKVIPQSLLTRFLLSLIPDGKKVPMPPDSAKPNAWYRETLAMMLERLAAGELHPIVAERFPLSEAGRAHEVLERAGTPARWCSFAVSGRRTGEDDGPKDGASRGRLVHRPSSSAARCSTS